MLQVFLGTKASSTCFNSDATEPPEDKEPNPGMNVQSLLASDVQECSTIKKILKCLTNSVQITFSVRVVIDNLTLIPIVIKNLPRTI